MKIKPLVNIAPDTLPDLYTWYLNMEENAIRYTSDYNYGPGGKWRYITREEAKILEPNFNPDSVLHKDKKFHDENQTE